MLRVGHRFYLPLILAPFILGAAGYWLIVLVDPYDLRPGGLAPRIADHRYPDLEWPKLIRAVTGEPRDVVLLGGSTTMAVTKAMMLEAYPDAQTPVNLSYIAPRPLDLADALGWVSRTPGLKRVVLIMDFSLMERRGLRSAAGNTLANMATTSWSHGGDFAPVTAVASFNRIARGVYDMPAWSNMTEPGFMVGTAPVTTSVGTMRRVHRAIESHQSDVFNPAPLTCEEIPFTREVLTPFLRKMAAQGVAVDMVFPPIPYVVYYDWIENPPRFDILLPGPVFHQFMVYKRCVIATREAIGGLQARVISLDTNDAISGNLRLYMDSVHLLDPQAYRDITLMMAAGDESLTSVNIDGHEKRLRDKIVRAGNSLLSAR